jgi:hypothetical protein
MPGHSSVGRGSAVTGIRRMTGRAAGWESGLPSIWWHHERSSGLEANHSPVRKRTRITGRHSLSSAMAERIVDALGNCDRYDTAIELSELVPQSRTWSRTSLPS